jgi:beta-glucosidase/6-phospho-beta-glucosidase/beta-galactosidase
MQFIMAAFNVLFTKYKGWSIREVIQKIQVYYISICIKVYNDRVNKLSPLK